MVAVCLSWIPPQWLVKNMSKILTRCGDWTLCRFLAAPMLTYWNSILASSEIQDADCWICWILADLCPRRENLPADMGITQQCHCQAKQSLDQLQIPPTRSQGMTNFLSLKISQYNAALTLQWIKLGIKSSNWSNPFNFLYVFQVGTLDVLVGLSDDLGKLDTFCER